jgi:hypothetical protein
MRLFRKPLKRNGSFFGGHLTPVAFNPDQGVPSSPDHSPHRGKHTYTRPGFKTGSRRGIEVEIMTQNLPYNYEGYLPGEEEEEEFSRFQQTLKVGTQAPDFEATRLEDGKKVKLSDLTVKSNVVLEFGSLT